MPVTETSQINESNITVFSWPAHHQESSHLISQTSSMTGLTNSLLVRGYCTYNPKWSKVSCIITKITSVKNVNPKLSSFQGEKSNITQWKCQHLQTVLQKCECHEQSEIYWEKICNFNNIMPHLIVCTCRLQLSDHGGSMKAWKLHIRILIHFMFTCVQIFGKILYCKYKHFHAILLLH